MPNAVADANTIVSSFIAGNQPTTSATALRALRQSHILVVSQPTLAEWRAVLLRPKFHRHGATPASVEGFIRRLLLGSCMVAPQERVTDCRDPKDAIYLEAARAGGAELILSGDADLLALHPWRGIRILRPAAFLAG